MFGKTNGLTALEMRKQLLVVESELNRAHLADEWRQVKVEARSLTDAIRMLGSLGSLAAQLEKAIGGFFKGFSNHDEDAENKKPSRVSTWFNVMKTGVSLWTALRSSKR